MVKTKLALIAALVLLAGCDPDARKMEAEVRSGLKDPDSAKFGETTFFHGRKVACGWVNAKNSYGAYAGSSRFVFFKNPKFSGYTQVDTDKHIFASDACSDSPEGKAALSKQLCINAKETVELWEWSLTKDKPEKEKSDVRGYLKEANKEVEVLCKSDKT